VRDNPTQAAFNQFALMGTSSVDDDGVRPHETLVIDHGILKNMLATRVPVSGTLQSTGSRRGTGALPSNVFINSEKALPPDELKKELLSRAKDRGLGYAVVVRRVGAESGASLMQRAMQMASSQDDSQSILEVYKLYADGHEEPLRGVQISDLPAESFKEIVATGDVPTVYSTELMPQIGSLFTMAFSFSPSTSLPVVSCVSPALLFDEVSLAKSKGPFPPIPLSPSPLVQK
jgi:predicted Zn-dependent protease